MFGLEKKKKALFEFDLEGDLKQHPEKKQALLKEIESKSSEIKNLLRSGIAPQDTENYATLLSGFGALQKVINRIPTQQKQA